jgi:hypothetical protein
MKLFPDPDCLPGYEAVPVPVALRYGAYSEPHDTHLSSPRKEACRKPLFPFSL